MHRTILRSYGRVSYTGSYAINLMAWPDIDIDMVLEPDPFLTDDFFKMGKEIVTIDGVLSLKFNNFLPQQVEGLTNGLYWGVRKTTWTTRWKIDISATDTEYLEKNRASMERIRRALDEETRRSIIQIKHALLTSEGRTPVLSGYHIYEAVLFKGLRYKGLRTEEHLRTYLRQQWIEGV